MVFKNLSLGLVIPKVKQENQEFKAILGTMRPILKNKC